MGGGGGGAAVGREGGGAGGTHGASERIKTNNHARKYTLSDPEKRVLKMECEYSGASDNGHSEEWTTSLQWTNCSPPAYILSIHFYL